MAGTPAIGVTNPQCIGKPPMCLWPMFGGTPATSVVLDRSARAKRSLHSKNKIATLLLNRWGTTDSGGVPQLMGQRPMLRKRLLTQVRRDIVPLADGWRYAGNVGRTRSIGTSEAFFAFEK